MNDSRARMGGAGVRRLGREALARIGEWLYPPTCVLCGGTGEPGRDLCPVCRYDLVPDGPACERCAGPVGMAGICGACQRKPPPFDFTIAALRYESPVDWLVQRFKFEGLLSCGVVLGDLLADAVSVSDLSPPRALIPVPLHRSRLRQRGFDQAREIARVLSRRLDIPIRDHCLRRIRPTAPQSALDEKGRRRNLRRAFSVGGQPPERVALVDDVMTTGSTVAECARVLRRAGCREIGVWVAARA